VAYEILCVVCCAFFSFETVCCRFVVAVFHRNSEVQTHQHVDKHCAAKVVQRLVEWNGTMGSSASLSFCGTCVHLSCFFSQIGVELYSNFQFRPDEIARMVRAVLSEGHTGLVSLNFIRSNNS
jgi:hypothetical protein